MATSMGYRSTMHRVLEIPEIVELIFTFLDEQTNKANTSVCCKWSEVALDVLWREVNHPHRLFRLLTPLTAGDDPNSYASFSKTLTPDDWRRFARYARRVRKLSYVTVGSKTFSLDQAIFDEIARTRTTLNILPNLQALEWRSTPASLRFSLMFMHENVNAFRVLLHDTPAYSIPDFFKDIADRMPHLTCLDLCFCFPVRIIEDALAELVQSLQKLSKIVMPIYCHTARMVEVLSTLPHLGTIQFEYISDQGWGDPNDLVYFSPSLVEGAFPALVDLSLSAYLPDMTRFLKGRFGPINLTSLYVHLLSPVPSSVVTEFLETVAQNCSQLTHIYLDLHIDADMIETVAAPSPPELLNFNVLRPLLTCAKLVSLEIRWDVPLQMTQQDVEELAAKMPQLEVLELDCEPIPLPIANEPLTLRALIPFAEHCPNLRELSLYLSATAADLDEYAHAASPPFLQPFRRLRRLCFGLSDIAEPGAVALFLSQLCPLGCEVTAGLTWQDAVEESAHSAFVAAFREACHAHYGRWAEVNAVLPLLVRLRMEERARRSALEREVEDLRVRCLVLEERATLRMAGDSSCLVL